ncbi:uncharacterized protein LOC143146759 [Ptiloglossa arizonensis]|uniref:uncharacterized protein LOC143146759 n=1 Tax=Ptiloglossa arizonensis TaxID=3350558 RepID=UPI003F9FF0E4
MQRTVLRLVRERVKEKRIGKETRWASFCALPRWCDVSFTYSCSELCIEEKGFRVCIPIWRGCVCFCEKDDDSRRAGILASLKYRHKYSFVVGTMILDPLHSSLRLLVQLDTFFFFGSKLYQRYNSSLRHQH